jgi:transcriptional regulator with XRE-family HTH domain
MDEALIGKRLQAMRRLRMWDQRRLAQEAGVSPTTVSGIETGRISKPHFGTMRKLARALEVEPEVLISLEESLKREAPPLPPPPPPPALLSLQWARAVEEEEFERRLEEASLEGLESLCGQLKDERGRLQRLYGEFPQGSEQRRFIKQQIRDVSAQGESVRTSMMFHPQKKGIEEHMEDGRERAAKQSLDQT